VTGPQHQPKLAPQQRHEDAEAGELRLQRVAHRPRALAAPEDVQSAVRLGAIAQARTAACRGCQLLMLLWIKVLFCENSGGSLYHMLRTELS